MSVRRELSSVFRRELWFAPLTFRSAHTHTRKMVLPCLETSQYISERHIDLLHLCLLKAPILSRTCWYALCNWSSDSSYRRLR